MKKREKDLRFHLNYTRKRGFIILFSVLLLIMIYLLKDASVLLRTALTISSWVLFYVGDHVFDVRLKKIHYALIFIMTIGGFMLSPLYYIYPQYDKIQHFLFPMIMFYIVFYLVNKQILQLKWKLVFSLFIVMALLGVHEIIEYEIDRAYDMKLQGVYIRDIRGIEKFNIIVDPLSDTMIDMIYGFVGATAFCIGYAFHKREHLHHKIFREV